MLFMSQMSQPVSSLTWQSQFSDTFGSYGLSGTSGTYVLLYAKSLFTKSGSSVRLTIQGGNSAPSTFNSVWVGKSVGASPNVYSFDGTQAQVKVSGVTNFTVGQNATVVCDVISVPFSSGSDFLVAMDWSSAVDYGIHSGVTGATLYYNSSGLDASTQSKSGYSNAAQNRFISLLEVLA